uniref:Palmitoyl-protein thioesterase 1 n=1 Tax=Meloidogyne enterolobii TaxID=390850 RepID=A0A6V7VS36_MELEN|nr:unnamed protein product [Meloidogyne enterolobii]
MNSILNFYLIFTIYCFLSVHAFYEDSEDFSFILEKEKIKSAPIPVVIWHGMGDSCCNPLSMYYIKKLIQTNIPGIYVKSVMLGNNVVEDVEKGFFSNMNEQINIVCEMLKEDVNLLKGYNAIGFSQGGLFMRAIAQRCPYPPIRNLISVGGPQQGVFGLPHCSGSVAICDTIRHLLDYGAYETFIQRTIVQAQFWHDPNKRKEYQRKNIFLTDLNCETTCNSTYKNNLLKLKNFVLIKFLKDEKMQPKQTSWFGFYAENDTNTIIPMEKTRLYQEDLIGLKTLEESGRLHFLSINGEHLHLPPGVFTKEIINKYLKDNSKNYLNEQMEDDILNLY